MAIHFTESEFAQRIQSTQAAMAARGLDAMLLFAPESHYYLTGYDTFGFAMFQCMVLPVDGDPHLLTRAPDLRQAQMTSTLADDRIHIWVDREGVSPVMQLLELLGTVQLAGKTLGIETRTVGLNAQDGLSLNEQLKSFAKWLDASDLVSFAAPQ